MEESGVEQFVVVFGQWASWNLTRSSRKKRGMPQSVSRWKKFNLAHWGRWRCGRQGL
jgi:hypothetical protein